MLPDWGIYGKSENNTLNFYLPDENIKDGISYNTNRTKNGGKNLLYNFYDFQKNNTYISKSSYPMQGITDYGSNPFVIDIKKATLHNNTFRTALWTGNHLQLTLMCIPVGGDIGLEVHPNVDQFLRIEDGHGLTQMGSSKDNLYLQQPVYDDFAIFIPAGTWHNIINTGNKPLKLYSIYAPPNHPKGVIHQTKEAAEAAENPHY